jgi:hypothetical protein
MYPNRYLMAEAADTTQVAMYDITLKQPIAHALGLESELMDPV